MRPSMIVAGIMVLMLCAVIATAETAGSTVPGTKAVDQSQAATPNDLKPIQCSGINLTAKISGSVLITGTGAAELITGSAAIDTISGGAGDDCILGGAGADAIDGGPGNDVCLGGAGLNTFLGCETTG